MLEDTMESLDDQDDLEDEAQEEVDKVLFELTKGIISSVCQYPVLKPEFRPVLVYVPSFNPIAGYM
jgi:hypothetical protein